MAGDGFEIDMEDAAAVGRTAADLAGQLPRGDVHVAPDAFGGLASFMPAAFNDSVQAFDDWRARTQAELTAFADAVRTASQTYCDGDLEAAAVYWRIVRPARDQ